MSLRERTRRAGLGIIKPCLPFPLLSLISRLEISATVIVRTAGIGVRHAKTFLCGNCSGFTDVCRCCDNASVCRRWRLGRGAHRWTCRRNDYRGRSHRPTLLSTAGLCGPGTLLLLDARRAGMGRLSRRVDLSSRPSLPVGFNRPAPAADARRAFRRRCSFATNARPRRMARSAGKSDTTTTE